jgi:hypothetical protein
MRPSRVPLYYYPNIIRRGVQVKKHLVMRFFRSRIAFSFLGPNIGLYVNPIVKHPQPVFSAKRERPSFTQQITAVLYSESLYY